MHFLVISLHSNQLNFFFVAAEPQDINFEVCTI